MMKTYDPKGYGKERTAEVIKFVEAKPPSHLSAIVHRYIELETVGKLNMDYRFHALPDACAYLVFDQLNSDVSGITKLRTTSEELNLGRQFHYINIRFFPGVCLFSEDEYSYGLVNGPYKGALPLLEANRKLASCSFEEKQPILTRLVEDMLAAKKIAPNLVTQKIFRNIDEINTVSEMAAASNLSARQLQRVLKRTTGLAPHDFLKVLRLQQTLNNEASDNYADQSHFIHSFRKATGYTPGRYTRKFDV